jgi:hypothetical protein
MKKLLSPTFFAVVVAAFFLPFVSVSCSTSGFGEGLGGFGEGLGEAGELDIPQGDIEVTATGLQIILNDVDQPEGLGDLGSDFGGAIQQPDPTSENFPGRMFAIMAAAAAILGLGLSFLRDRAGAVTAIVLGLGAALFLFLLKNAIDGELGGAQLLGFQVSYKYGYWLALLFGVAAAAAGVWRLMSERAVVMPPAATGEPPPPAPPGEPPPPAPSPEG